MFFINFPLTGGSNGHHPVLQGIYDNGLHQCGLDRNEALTASYLYPELLNVTSSFNARRSQRLLRPQSSSLSSSSGVSTTTVSSIQHQQYVDEQRQYLTVKKWVIVVLVLMLLMTVSLLVGISLQHFQLLRKFLDSKTTTQAYIPSTTTELPTLSYDKVDESENYIPK